MREFNAKEQLFVSNRNQWQDICKRDMETKKSLEIEEVDGGIILPLRKRIGLKPPVSRVYEGGVTDKNGNFITGHSRTSRDGLSGGPRYTFTSEIGYTPEFAPKYRDEIVVFGGVLISHYGHALAESITRLWWFADNPDTPYKIVFLNVPTVWGEFKFFDILEAAGLTQDRIEILEEPTAFKKIIVPEESCMFSDGFYTGHEKIFNLIKSRLPESPHKKVYFSRSRYARGDGVNENYFEDFYRNRGFHIVYPEELTFTEKAALVYGAEEYVSLVQSGIFTLYCAKPNLKATLLVRAGRFEIAHWFPLQLNDINYTIIHANFNFLPSSHAGQHVYLYGPTPCWIDYLDQTGIEYKPEEVSLDIHLKNYLYDYILQWAENYAHSDRFERIKNSDIIDVLHRIKAVFHQEGINRKDYPEPDKIVKLRKDLATAKDKTKLLTAEKNALSDAIQVAVCRVNSEITEVKKDEDQYKQKNEELLKQVQQLKSHISSMEDSLSWRLTTPLRAFKKWIKKLTN